MKSNIMLGACYFLCSMHNIQSAEFAELKLFLSSSEAARRQANAQPSAVHSHAGGKLVIDLQKPVATSASSGQPQSVASEKPMITSKQKPKLVATNSGTTEIHK